MPKLGRVTKAVTVSALLGIAGLLRSRLSGDFVMKLRQQVRRLVLPGRHAALRFLLLSNTLVFTLLISTGCAYDHSPARAPGCPECDDVSVLTPTLDCIATDGEGTQFAVWGYKSTEAAITVHAPVGRGNRMFPGPPGLGQPSTFLPGTNAGVFATPLDLSSGVGWILGSGVAYANPATASKCEVMTDLLGDVALVPDAGSTTKKHVELNVNIGKVLAPTITESEASIPPNRTRGTPPITAGFMAGRFEVSNDGAGMYSLPLTVPDGRLGLQPDLSLSYSSRGGNGVVGVGWTLQGFSRIERCKKNFSSPNGLTRSEDGEVGPIVFASDNRLCLDGDYLIRIPNPENPNFFEYRPEHQPTTKVVADAPDLGSMGPPSFTVFEKGGRVRRYGTSPEARMEGYRTRVTAHPSKLDSPTDTHVEELYTEKARLSWEISEISDRSGNTILFDYETSSRCDPVDTARCHTLEVRPKSIRYTVGPEHPTPERSVRFFYTAGRPDPQTRFVSGYEVRSASLLKRIETWGPYPTTEGHVRSYLLTYNWEASSSPLEGFPDSFINLPQKTVTGRSLLQRVQECDSAGVCKAPTRFEWERGLSLFEDIDTTIGKNGSDDLGWGGSPEDGGAASGSQHWAILIADIDGDGKDDILYRKSKRLAAHGCPDAPAYEHCDDQVEWFYRLSVDTPGGRHGFDPVEHAAGLPIQHAENKQIIPVPRAVDLTGDGRVALLFPAQGLLSASSGLLVQPRWQVWRFDGDAFKQVVPDEAAETTGTPLQLPCANCNIWPSPLYIADLQGDGLPDLIRPVHPTYPGIPEDVALTEAAWAYRSNGAGGISPTYVFFNAPPPVMSPSPPPTEWTFYAKQFGAAYVADIDGSGRNSLLVRNRAMVACGSALCSTDGVRYTGLNLEGPTGVAAHHASSLPIIEREHPYAWHYIFLDINGDGLQDALFVPDRGTWELLGGVEPKISVNTGNGFRAFEKALGPPPILGVAFNATNEPTVDAGMRAADYNEDGVPDVILFGNRGGRDSSGGGSVVALERSNVIVYQSNGSRLNYVPGPFARSADTTGFKGIPAQDSSGTRLPWVEHRGYPLSQVLDVNGDGLADLLTWDPATGSLHLYKRDGKKADLLTVVHNGIGHQVRITYSPFVQGRSETDPACSYPLTCVMRGLWVVSAYSASTDEGAFRTLTYSYAGAALDRRGRGWLGFSRRVERDGLTSATRTTDFHRHTERLGSAYPFAMRPTHESRVVLVDAGNTERYDRSVSAFQVIGDPAKSQPYVVHERTVEESTTENSSVLRSVRTSSLYDSFNDGLKYRKTVVGGGSSEEIEQIDYDDFPLSWSIGLPRKVAQTSTALTPWGPESVTRVTTFVHDKDTGLLKRKTVEPDGGPDVWLNTQVIRNPSGQVIGVIARDASGEQREFWTEYRLSDGVYPSSIADSLGHVTRYEYHGGLGVLGRLRDANGGITVFNYDRFGRMVRQRSDGSGELTQRHLIDGFGAYTTVTENSGGGRSITRYDRLARPFQQVSTGFSGENIRLDIGYDPVFPHRVRSVLGPWNESDVGAMPATFFHSDKLGRTTEVVYPGGSVSSRSYALQRTETISEDGNASAVELDQMGRVRATVHRALQSIDNATPHDIHTTYAYGPFGQLRRITDEKGNMTTSRYDVLGRRVALSDPDSGETKNTYNAFGELRSETNANGITTEYFRDEAGRLTATVNSLDGTTCWQYDSATFGIGLLAKSLSPDGVIVKYNYDKFGRLTSLDTRIGSAEYRFGFDYDAEGRQNRIYYPKVTDPASGLSSRLVLTSRYALSNGELAEVLSEASLSGDPKAKDFVYWRTRKQSPRGQIEEQAFANGATGASRIHDPKSGRLIQLSFANSLVAWPSTLVVDDYTFGYKPSGLLETLTDASRGLVETFKYDSTGQLTEARGSSEKDGLFHDEYAYDDLGNLRRFSSETVPERNAIYEIDGTFGPHAVTSMTRSGSPSEKYGYDKTGNQTAGPGRTISFSGFGLAKSISKDGALTSFRYDASRTRAVRDSIGESTTYVNDLYERRVKGADVLHVMYIPGPEGLVGQVQWQESGAGLRKSVQYFLADHLGSVGAVTDNKGSIVARQRFEPFGRRLEASSMTVEGTAPKDVTLGYTAHETDDAIGLINMRGRHYDPVLRRFISPDPMAGSTLGTHLTNRYGYVSNSPLVFTDPTGFWPETSTVHVYGDRPEPPIPTSGDEPTGTPPTITPERPIFNPGRSSGGSGSSQGVFELRALVARLKNQAVGTSSSSADDSGNVAYSPAGFSDWERPDPWGLLGDLHQMSAVATSYATGKVTGYCSTCTSDSLDPVLGPWGAIAYAHFQDAYGAAQTQFMLDVSDAALTVIGSLEAAAKIAIPRPIGGGGPYGLSRQATKGLGGEWHHMPAKSAMAEAPKGYAFSSWKGGAIWMERSHHQLTKSWGPAGAAYRSSQATMLKQGKFLDVLAEDILDIQRVENAIGQAGLYERQVQGMLDYYWGGKW
jgi:RHS repeat-associated protein